MRLVQGLSTILAGLLGLGAVAWTASAQSVPAASLREDQRSSLFELGRFGLGVDVSPLGHYRLADTDLRTTAVAFDLRLRWPSAGSAVPIQPYLSLGPALLISQRDDVVPVLPTASDVSVVLGAKAALGATWRLSEGTSLFGEYRLVHQGQERRGPAEALGLDLLYGFSKRF